MTCQRVQLGPRTQQHARQRLVGHRVAVDEQQTVMLAYCVAVTVTVAIISREPVLSETPFLLETSPVSAPDSGFLARASKQLVLGSGPKRPLAWSSGQTIQASLHAGTQKHPQSTKSTKLLSQVVYVSTQRGEHRSGVHCVSHLDIGTDKGTIEYG
jgi:hypothetical protein